MYYKTLLLSQIILFPLGIRVPDGNFFKVTLMLGDETRQGMTTFFPSVIFITLGISLRMSTKGLPVSLINM